MLTFKKKEIEGSLLSIAAYDQKGAPIYGLMYEKVSLGAKRKLQKIQTKLAEAYKEYEKDLKEIEDTCKDDEEKKKAEIEILNNEDLQIEAEPVDMKFIEGIDTTHTYDFDLIEKFAK